MYDNLDKIKELKALIKEQEILERTKNEIAKPILTDFKYLPILHKTYIEVTGGDDRDPESRSAFLLLMAILYSPGTLAGMRSRRHYREKMATLFSFISPCTISLNTSTAVFHYIHYSWYRERVDAVFEDMKTVFKKNNPKLYELLK